MLDYQNMDKCLRLREDTVNEKVFVEGCKEIDVNNIEGIKCLIDIG